MIHETIALWDKHPEATLTSYCITSTAEDRRFTVGARHSLSDKPRALFMASQNMADLCALA
mgnify:CR=1 FL=1